MATARASTRLITRSVAVAHGHVSFDPLTMALTGLPSLLAVWLRLRIGSLLMPVLLHNFGNSASLLIRPAG